MADIPDERTAVAALALALAPTPVYWGWAPLEGAESPPSLALVTLQRLQFVTASYEDMCEGEPIVGDTTLVVHVWAGGYEEARALQDETRAAMLSVGGWTLQVEADAFEPAFRAWRIESQWFAGAIPV